MTDVTPGAPAAVAPIKRPFTWANAVAKVKCRGRVEQAAIRNAWSLA